ncbi:MAG TPA: hypothetical protein VEK57_20300 [Thermoanaerobaculia bacterium]|nr:hypothetical protein [Thermoanaerobaculia bacterium]
MSRTFDAVAAKRIADAVREIESRSSAELIVEIRARSGSYAHADGRFAAFLALVSLVVLVFMPLVVPPITVLLSPVAFYALGLAIAGRSAALRRLCTSRNERLQAVRTQAAALFHDRAIANTSEESGVLFYASLLERRIEVLADRGLLRKLVPNDWNALLAKLHVERVLDPETIVEDIRALGVMLERAAPAGETNADELPNAPEITLV